MSHFTKIIVGAAAAALLLAGCTTTSGENPLNLVKPGTLTVCSEPPYPPFEYEDPNSPSGYSGFDIDLMAAIADGLNLKLVISVTDFDALQSGAALAANTCDVGASAITITADRKKNIDFADPYYDSLQSLLIPASSPVKTLADMAGMRIGVQTGTTGKMYAEANAPQTATLVSFPGDGEMWLALKAGQVDALLQDLPVNADHVAQDPSYVIIERYQTDEQYGFAFAKDKKPELLKAVNAQLKTLRSNGTYDTIYKKYFG